MAAVEGNADRLGTFLAGERPTVVSFGKLIELSGVHALFEALRGLEATFALRGEEREAVRAAARRAAVTRCTCWSWSSVAERIVELVG